MNFPPLTAPFKNAVSRRAGHSDHPLLFELVVLIVFAIQKGGDSFGQQLHKLVLGCLRQHECWSIRMLFCVQKFAMIIVNPSRKSKRYLQNVWRRSGQGVLRVRSQIRRQNIGSI